MVADNNVVYIYGVNVSHIIELLMPKFVRLIGKKNIQFFSYCFSSMWNLTF